MRAPLALALMTFLLLPACAGNQPVPSVSAPTAETAVPQTDLNHRVSDLEEAAARLRDQHLAMSETLTWVEGEIKAIKQQTGTVSAPLTPPATIIPPEEAGDAGADAEAQPTRETPSTTEPTPQAGAAQAVGDLTDQDLEVQAPTPGTAPPAAAGNAYVVHIASYLQSAQVKPGWTQLQQQYAAALEGLSAYVAPFRDGHNRNWLRLHAGLIENAEDATARCNQIKAMGSWCEVMTVSRAEAHKLD